MTRKQATRWFALMLACGGCNEGKLVELPDDVGERYAEALCAAEATCGCQKYGSIDECESDVLAAFERATEYVSSFDEACFEQVLDNIEERGCVNATEYPTACFAIVGATRVSEACEADPRMVAVMPAGTCEPDSYCDLWSGVCSTGGAYPIHADVGIRVCRIIWDRAGSTSTVRRMAAARRECWRVKRAAMRTNARRARIV